MVNRIDRRVIDIAGQRFGRLVAIAPTEMRAPATKTKMWRCVCDCGQEKLISLAHLRQGRTKSCGCLDRDTRKQKQIDLTGTTSGFLSYTGEAGLGKGSRRIECLCACGRKHVVLANSYISGGTKSCGCLHQQVARDLGRTYANAKDMTGQRFGRWTVVERDGSTSLGYAKWKCRCDCGGEKTVHGRYLRNGMSTSCGCYQREVSSELAKQMTAARRAAT